jgi:hypothetical protein
MLRLEEYWSCVIDTLKIFPCKTRVKWSKISEPTIWEDRVFIPTSHYVETGTLDPVPMREVEWIEVDTIEIRYIGRLVADRRIEHMADLMQAFEEKAIPFQQIGQLLRFTYLSV